MMRSLRLLLPIAWLFALNTQAKIYSWIDENQVTHFSDRLEKETHPVQLLTEQALSVLESPQPSRENTTVTAAKHPSGYSELIIDQPSDETNVYDNQGLLTIRLTLKPALQTGHQFLFWLDDRLLKQARATQLQLMNLDRGRHTLQVQVQNQHGQIIITSKTVCFYLHRASIQSS